MKKKKANEINKEKKVKKVNLQEQEGIQWNLEYSNKKLNIFIADIITNNCCNNFNKKTNLDKSGVIPNWNTLNNKGDVAKVVMNKSKIIEDIMRIRMIEMENLVQTYWAGEIIKHIQKKWIPNYKTYIWSWKLDEIIDEMEILKANILIIWNILKPHQIYNINQKLQKIGAKAWDRVDLILKIFEKHAHSIEAKLQIELASIRHMWPRIFWMGMDLSRQWGWIGTSWKWETNTEIMKRHLAKRTNHIKKELEKYSRVRDNHRSHRKRLNLKIAWIVWYTNAWKSTFLNSITNKKALVKDALFATLWTSVWKMWCKPDEWEYIWKEYLISDTIWFIRDLPPELIKAFTSTLEDSIHSDLLLHVIDSSDPELDDKIDIVDNILSDIWANQDKIYIFNKIDLIEEWEEIELDQEWNILNKPEKNTINYLKYKYKYLNPIFISAYTKINLENIKNLIQDKLW